MNPQHLPEFTGPRFHRRELRYTQAPALPVDQHWATPIDHTRPARRIEMLGRVVASLAVGAIVVLALIACGDDIHTAQADAQAVADAKAHAVQLKQEWRELEALASLSGSKQ
jgi:hypothetical protein